jgi:hypothetical protein
VEEEEQKDLVSLSGMFVGIDSYERAERKARSTPMTGKVSEMRISGNRKKKKQGYKEMPYDLLPLALPFYVWFLRHFLWDKNYGCY